MASDAMLSKQTIERTHVERGSSGADSSWLVWKEVRQLFPLLALLALIASMVAGILLLQSLLGSAPASSTIPVALILFPAIFATGTGPLLVGQERASRTLDWLNLLPIGTGRIFGVKYCISLAGLAVMWVLHFLLLQIFGHGDLIFSGWWVDGGASLIPIGYAALFLHSLFVLQAGFYVAWRIQNQFHSLIVLIPLIALPILIVNGLQIADIMNSGESGILFFSAVGWLWLMPLSYIAARRTLGALPAPRVSGFRQQRLVRSSSTRTSETPSFESSSSAFIWQTFASTQLTWIMLLAMLLLSFVVLAMTASFTARDLGGPFAGVLSVVTAGPALLAVAWLGVMVFKYDGSVAQVQFLSQRGVAPWKILLCRHLVPVALLCGCGCVYGLWQWLAVPSLASDDRLVDHHPLPSLSLLLCIGLVIYSAGQWVSQLVRTLILAVILAPIAGGILLAWFGFAWIGLGTPIWLLGICAFFPLVATFLIQQKYCDGHEQVTGYILGVVVIGSIFGIPIADAARRISQVAGMDEDTKSILLAEGRALKRTSSRETRNPFNEAFIRSYVSSIDTKDTFAPIEFTERSLALYETNASEWLRTLADVQDDETFQFSTNEVETWYQRTQLARIRYQQLDDEESLTAYLEYLQWGSRALPPARRCQWISGQHAADYLESLLVELLQQQPASNHRDRSEVIETIANLGTPESRARARRAAVLVSAWSRYAPGIIRTQPEALSYWLKPRYGEQWIAAMLVGIEASKEPNHSDDWCRDLIRLQNPGQSYEGSIYQYIQDGGDVTLIPPPNSDTNGAFWGGRWEYVDFRQGESDDQ
ncbi:MAG: hypothetical protein AAF802_10990 [Planctomycetota bacterium]